MLPLQTKYGEQYDPKAAQETGIGRGKSTGGLGRGGDGDGMDAEAHHDFLARMRENVSSQQAMADRADALAEVLGYEKTQDDAARRIQQGLARGKADSGKGESGGASGAAREEDWRDQRKRVSGAYRSREQTASEAKEQELRARAAHAELGERARQAADVSVGKQTRPTELETELRREDQRREDQRRAIAEEDEERRRADTLLKATGSENESNAARSRREANNLGEQERKDAVENRARLDVDAEEATDAGGAAVAAPMAPPEGGTKVPEGGPWLTDAGPDALYRPREASGVLAVAAREEVVGRGVREAAGQGLHADEGGLGGVAREQLKRVGAVADGPEQEMWAAVPLFPGLPSQRRVVNLLRRCVPGEFRPSPEDIRRARVAKRREQQGLQVDDWELDEKANGGFVVLRRDLWTGAVWRQFWREGAIVDCGPAEIAREQARREAAAKAEEDPEGAFALASIMGGEGSRVGKSAAVRAAEEAAADRLQLPALLPSDPLLVTGSRRL